MSKLLNLWFSRVGHKEARLHGTHIKFYDPEFNDKPVDTIISLRNGGGKSSIIQLLYSVFQPRKQNFARAEGDARKFEDYFRQGELGFIVTEWTIDDQNNGLFGSTNKTRIIGQCVLRTSQTNESGSPILKRLFFSFISSEKLSFHHLPLGFNNQAETNIDDFKLWFNEKVRNLPALEPFINDRQKDWLEFLRKRGFIPEQFQLLAKMNEKEGSADDILAITKIEQFLELVLTPLIDPNNVKNLPSVIKQHKEKLKKVPKLKQEKILVEKLYNQFVALQQPANEYLSLFERRAENVAARQQIAARLIKTDISIRNEKLKCENYINRLKSKKYHNKQEICNFSAGIEWLEYENRRLIYIDKKRKHEAASKALNEQTRQRDLYVAAQSLEKLRDSENRCAALQNEIEQANAPVAEIAAQVHSVGFVYYQVVENKVKKIEADLNNYNKKKDQIKNAIAVRQEELGKTKERIKTLEKNSDSLQKWLNQADSQLRQLQSSGYIQTDETPSLAIARIDEELAKIEKTRTELNTTLEEIKESDYQYRNEKQSVNDKITELQNEAKKADEKLLVYQNELQNLSHNQTLCELTEADEINPYSPNLENSIKTAQEKLNQELRQIQNKLDLDQEDVDALSKYQVLPPGRDVRTVLQHLKDKDIGAYSYGEYLTEQGDITPDTIREQMNCNPARYGGIAVTSPEHLERVKQEFQTLENLRSPVQITFVTCPETVNEHLGMMTTVMPTSNATFDKKAAAREKVRLEQNIKNNNTRLSDINEKYTAYDEVLSTLREFLKAHPEGAEARYQQDVTDIQEHISSEIEHLEKLEHEIEILRERQESVSVSLKETELKKLNNNNYKKAVEKYINRYEEQRLDKEQELQQAKEERLEKLKKLDELENAIEQDKTEEQRLIGEIDKQKDNLKSSKDTLNNIELRSPKDSSLITRYENYTEKQLHEMYLAKKVYYDEGSKKSEKLRGKLEVLNEQRTEAQNEYDKKRGSFDKQEVIETLANCEQAIDESLIKALNDKVLKARDVKILAESKTNQAKQEFTKFVVPQKPDELTSYESLEKCSDILSQWKKKLEEAQQTEKTIKAEITTTQKKLDKIITNIALLKTAVKAAKEEFPDESLLETYNPFDSAEEAETEWGQIGEITQKLDQQFSDAKGKVDNLQNKINQILNNDREVNPALFSRILEIPDYYKNVPERIKELSNRIDTLNHSLESADKRRREIVGFFRVPIESAIRQLKYLNQASKCPPNSGIWKAWSGEPFIKVKINSEVLKVDYLHKTLEEYLSHLVNNTKGITENPVLLIKNGIYKLLDKKIKIQIFKPSDTPTTERISIVDVGKFSGGEKLTTAIMIYCGIVRVIAYSQNQNPSNFLLLDNPLGKCNYIPFVQMQREMAKLTNTQLIYATGIHEKESLGEFPRIVTLQNQHRDQKTGDRYVKELEIAEIETVEAQFKEQVENETA